MWVEPPPGWQTLGSNVDWPGLLEFSGDIDAADGLPLWERRTNADPV